MRIYILPVLPGKTSNHKTYGINIYFYRSPVCLKYCFKSYYCFNLTILFTAYNKAIIFFSTSWKEVYFFIFI